MKAKYRLKKGMEVVVIAGAHKGQRGKLLNVSREKGKVWVERVGLRKKYVRKTQENPEGSVVEKETPIAYSNVLSVTNIEKREQRRKSKKGLSQPVTEESSV
ncbi:MAG: 50S ribosomal protein L24 [Puniceicoccales bacterium]|jgi:large subunit ribosomal protein L24|nr:50S ribosomal protein L24 [Puniceicoccales bacterium]